MLNARMKAFSRAEEIMYKRIFSDALPSLRFYDKGGPWAMIQAWQSYQKAWLAVKAPRSHGLGV